MSSGVFVTGTDTGVGKSWVSAGLLRSLAIRGRRVVGYKPVATGCQQRSAGLHNDDALLLQRFSSGVPEYQEVNPIALAPPVAPLLAAREAGRIIGREEIAAGYYRLADQYDWVVVEGVGGWRVALGDELDMSQVVQQLKLPVVLVVGVRLGAINHTRLTLEAIQSDGLQLAGWVANQIDPSCAEVEANIALIASAITAPCLGSVPYLQNFNVDDIAAALNIEGLST